MENTCYACPWMAMQKSPWSKLVATQVRLQHTHQHVTNLVSPGLFTKALVDVAPGKNLLGFGSMMSWNEWVLVWARIHGVECRFERLDRKIVENAIPGGIGKEVADMYGYISDFGYDGGDPSIVHPRDVSCAALNSG